MNTRLLGAWGEEIALKHYKKMKFKPVALGYRTRHGEIDIIVENKEYIVSEGNMILFRPGETQMYYYHAEDKTEVYWVHFTGRHVESILEYYRIKHSASLRSTRILQI